MHFTFFGLTEIFNFAISVNYMNCSFFVFDVQITKKKGTSYYMQLFCLQLFYSKYAIIEINDPIPHQNFSKYCIEGTLVERPKSFLGLLSDRESSIRWHSLNTSNGLPENSGPACKQMIYWERR